MDFKISEEQTLFCEAFRNLLIEKSGPDHLRSQWEQTEQQKKPSELWQSMAEMGVLGAIAPDSVDGSGLDEVQVCGLLMEAGYAALPEALLEHAIVGIPALMQTDAAEAKEWLKGAVSGDLKISAAFASEGENKASLVNGAESGDLLILEEDNQLFALLSEKATLTACESVDKNRRISRIEWSSKDAVLLSGTDRDLMFDRAVVGAAAECVGAGQRILEMTVEYAGQREQFGKAIGSQQAVKHRVSDIAISLKFARAYVFGAAWETATGAKTRSREVSAAKSLASDAAVLACQNGLWCHGAIGYTTEYDLHFWLKRASSLAGSYGTAEWHRNRVAQALGV